MNQLEFTADSESPDKRNDCLGRSGYENTVRLNTTEGEELVQFCTTDLKSLLADSPILLHESECSKCKTNLSKEDTTHSALLKEKEKLKLIKKESDELREQVSKLEAKLGIIEADILSRETDIKRLNCEKLNLQIKIILKENYVQQSNYAMQLPATVQNSSQPPTTG